MRWLAMSNVRRGKIMRERHCKQIFAMLSNFLEGQLPAKNYRQLERHLKGCRPCIAYLESLKTTVEACRRYRRPGLPPLEASEGRSAGGSSALPPKPIGRA